MFQDFENDQIIDRGDIEKLIRMLVGDQNQDIDKEIEVFAQKVDV
jgi:hypothetical protein